MPKLAYQDRASYKINQDSNEGVITRFLVVIRASNVPARQLSESNLGRDLRTCGAEALLADILVSRWCKVPRSNVKTRHFLGLCSSRIRDKPHEAESLP